MRALLVLVENAWNRVALVDVSLVAPNEKITEQRQRQRMVVEIFGSALQFFVGALDSQGLQILGSRLGRQVVEIDRKNAVAVEIRQRKS